MSTTFAASAFAELDKFKTPNFDAVGTWEYQDADDELRQIAKYICQKSSHNSDVDPERLKFFYTTKIKKDGGRFVLGSLTMRSDIERMVNDEYDYIVTIYYPVWKDLDSKNKAIQLDKLLCGVELLPGKDPAEVKVKKKQTDSREYIDNMRFFGPEEVLNSSEIVDLAVQRIMEEELEQKRQAKEQRKKNKENKGNE